MKHMVRVTVLDKKLYPELVQEYKAMGYSVRAWGVKNEELMHRVIASGADGMTVNYPDRLKAYVDSKAE